MPTQTVAEFMQALLRSANLTQTALSRHLKISQGTISKWVNGQHIPNLAQWDRVLNYAQQNARTRHLLADAPELSLDALVEPYGPEERARIWSMVEGYLRSVPKP